MSAETPSSGKSERAASRNADYRWAEFDSEAYFQHYYGEPHQDDERVIRLAVAAVKSARPAGAELDVVDVGTGPNLFPLFCTLPRARRLTAWEYATSNIAWLEAELRRPEARWQWRHFWEVAREAWGPAYRLPDDPTSLLRERCAIRQGSIFELPQRAWDAATMFFCAESITGSRDEFEAACASYARCARPGGLLAAAFLVRSGGYVVADRPFPVLHVTAEEIEQTFARYAHIEKVEKVGIVEREIRSGYSGFVFITGTAR